MPVTLDAVFATLPSPAWGSPRIRKAKKVTFETEGGYKQQREKWPYARYAFPLKWALLSTAEVGTLSDWLDDIGSASFGFQPPAAMWGGLSNSGPRLVRVISYEITVTPLSYGWYAIELTLEDV